MIRFKKVIFFYSNRSSQSKICFKQRLFKNTYRTAIRRSTLSESLITLVYYLLLICILINSAISSFSPNLIFYHHLNTTKNSSNLNHSSNKDSVQFLNATKPHNLIESNLNNREPFLTKVLNNQKSSNNKAISSVLSLKRINLSSELTENVFASTQQSLDLTNLNNRWSLSKDEINNLTQHSDFIEPTLSSLLFKLSTFPPLIIHETDLDKQDPPNSTYNNATELMKYNFPIKITISVGLLILIISTIIGNIFVIGKLNSTNFSIFTLI